MFGSDDLLKNLLNLSIDGVVEIPQCGLYAKSPEALRALFEELKKLGYGIKDCAEEDKERLHSRAEKEKNGWSLWYAQLRDDVSARKGVCGSCGSYIETRGIAAHAHRCEACGAYTHLDFVDGSVIRFYLMNDVRGECSFFGSDISMKVYRFDEDRRRLLLYPEPLPGRYDGERERKNAKETLRANRSQYGTVRIRLSKGERKHVRRLKAQGRYDAAESFVRERGMRRPLGMKLISMPYESHRVGVINTCDISGQVSNYRIVKLYQGKEYREWDRLPLPESYSIYEAWHFAPLGYGPKLHEKIMSSAGLVSRCDYYCQDGRRDFSDIHLHRMRLFVEHFTVIPIEKWDAFIEQAPMDGPGLIRAMAAFCQNTDAASATYENRPNVFNLIGGLAKFASGLPLSQNELDSMNLTARDPASMGLIADVYMGKRRR